MNTTISIQLKAGFLLGVFGLNTVVGLACSLGIDMGFNAPNHDKGGKGSVHVHKDGKVHVHKLAVQKGHHLDSKATSKKDDCCKGKVVKLQTADKNMQYSKISVRVPECIIPKAFTKAGIPNIRKLNLREYFACHFHPPPRDIRIAIRSFQI